LIQCNMKRTALAAKEDPDMECNKCANCVHQLCAPTVCANCINCVDCVRWLCAPTLCANCANCGVSYHRFRQCSTVIWWVIGYVLFHTYGRWTSTTVQCTRR
jgi:hypothetical protein